MNPTTKTSLEPEGILSTIRANDSPGVRNFYDYMTGRSQWLQHGHQYFAWEVDAFGKQFLNMNTSALEGFIAWEVYKWKIFKILLADRKIGINPRVLFRPVEEAINGNGN